MDKSGPSRNGAPRNVGSYGACFIAAKKAERSHQPDGRFPILRTGSSQHADDSMRNECWGNSSVSCRRYYLAVELQSSRLGGCPRCTETHQTVCMGRAAAQCMPSSCWCGAFSRYQLQLRDKLAQRTPAGHVCADTYRQVKQTAGTKAPSPFRSRSQRTRAPDNWTSSRTNRSGLAGSGTLRVILTQPCVLQRVTSAPKADIN